MLPLKRMLLTFFLPATFGIPTTASDCGAETRRLALQGLRNLVVSSARDVYPETDGCPAVDRTHKERPSF